MSKPPSRGIFVTGTDTGVGKTWVAVHLVAALRSQGFPVRPCKPVESGLSQYADESESDAGLLCSAAGMTAIREVSRFRLAEPVAPPVAAQREGVTFRLQDLQDFCREAPGIAVVEGAGGWRSPLACDGDVRDLAVRMGLPVLVVAEDRLGAINQAVLTCEDVSRAPACELAGVVLNRVQDSIGDALANEHYLREKLEVPVWRTDPGRWLSAREERALLARFVELPGTS